MYAGIFFIPYISVAWNGVFHFISYVLFSIPVCCLERVFSFLMSCFPYLSVVWKESFHFLCLVFHTCLLSGKSVFISYVLFSIPVCCLERVFSFLMPCFLHPFFLHRAYVNCTGPGFALHSDIVMPYITHYGTKEQIEKFIPRMMAGTCIGAIAMTEPGAGRLALSQGYLGL